MTPGFTATLPVSMRHIVVGDAMCAAATSSWVLFAVSRSRRSFRPSCRRTTVEPAPLPLMAAGSHVAGTPESHRPTFRQPGTFHNERLPVHVHQARLVCGEV